MRIFVSLIAAGLVAVGALIVSSSQGPQEEPLTFIREEMVDTPKETKEVKPDAITLTPQMLTFSDGTEVTYQVADGFDIAIAAEDMGKARFMTWSPDGRMFVPDMINYNLSHDGKIYILDDWNEKTKRFDSKSVYLSGLRGPHNVAFYTDKDGKSWIYVPLTEHLLRYPYKAGDMEPSGEPEVIVSFPNQQSEDADGIVWHITRTVLFHDDTLFVSVGSGCNICEEKEDEYRAMILAMNPDGSNVHIYASGIKNPVGLEWANDSLYATENGVDHLGADAPDDVMYKVQEGEHYGWPYCYELDGEKHDEPGRTWERKPGLCDELGQAFVSFGPHTAPLGVTYFEDASSELAHTFLVALQGSWQPELRKGYQVVRVTEDGAIDVFIDGLQAPNGERLARPVGILQKDKGSFFFTDDYNGKIYYVYAK